MIESISIRDFAVISSLDVDLKRGLNIFTGETGAGKSVIIEAISMALGSRADTGFVRTGCDKASVTLVIDTDDCNIDSTLETIGVTAENPLIIKREISTSSKSICRINGSVVPLSSLNLLCKKIADIHGQYDQQILLDENNHINILDSYGRTSLESIKNDVSSAFNRYAELSGKLYDLKKDISASERQRDFLKFEYKEIKEANLIVGEDEELEETIKLMQNSEQLFKVLSSIYGSLFENDNSADSSLGSAVSYMQSIQGIAKDIDAIAERISNAYYELDDINKELRSLKDSISYSQQDLDKAIERHEKINSLKRKYGGSVQSVLEYAQKAKNSLLNIQNADSQIKELEKEIIASKDDFDKKALILSSKRKDVAEELECKINTELAELNFKNAQFVVLFENGSSSELGTDKIKFLISTNIGEDLKPLASTASGGELSRIMLALKRVTGDTDSVPTMIFDEIDTGISGMTAAVVGDKLESISNNHQVVCITHLPQIACKGESHFKIDKLSDESSTNTTIVPLNNEERIEEIARLLSGTFITDSARTQAKELLKN